MDGMIPYRARANKLPPRPYLELRVSQGALLILPINNDTVLLRRFELFPHALVGGRQGGRAYDAMISGACSSPSTISSVRRFYAEWRPGLAGLASDPALIRRLNQDVHSPLLATFYFKTPASLHVAMVRRHPASVVTNPVGDVGNWSVEQKLVAMFQAMIDQHDLQAVAGADWVAFQKQLEDLLTPINLSILAVALAGLVAAQGVPGLDVVIDTLLVGLAWTEAGYAGLLAIRSLIQAVIAAGTARTQRQIDAAAKELASALFQLGVMTFLTVLISRIRLIEGFPEKEPVAEDASKQAPSRAARPIEREAVNDPDCAQLAHAKDMAQLSTHVYGDDPSLPDGYRYLDPTTEDGKNELASLGLTPQRLAPDNSSFRASIYASGPVDNPAYVVAYRGTASLEDWGQNLLQGVGLPSSSYKQAIALGNKLLNTEQNVSFTGHSLGGGLAAAASVITGQPATTFNAAGLSPATVGGFPAVQTSVTAYNTADDILSTSLDASVLPCAYGDRFILPPISNRSYSWEAHKMASVQQSIIKKMEDLGCP
ncbi:MAG: DUF2974 domain-containing protein [Acidiphilium sp.]|nr:DUF2974 domain-containing protein [Acidiphilium sp.]